MIAWWQILLLTLYAGYQIMDELNWYTCAGSAVFSGMITGLIMGDLQTGLFIGGSMQLTVLGVGTFGGASRIDANSGTLVATAFAVGAGMNPETALAAIGVPVAAILVYTDIAGRFANTFFGHMCDADIEKMNWGAYNVHYLLGAVSWMLSRMIPVFLALAFGQGVVEGITTALTATGSGWVTVCLLLAVPCPPLASHPAPLPAGQKARRYLLLGFVVAALFGTAFTSIMNLNANIVAVNGALGKGAVDMVGMFNNMSMLAIAIIGFALSLLYYKNNQRPVAAAGAAEGDDDDEL